VISVGCDVGALYAKLVVLDEDRLLARRVLPTTGRMGESLEPALAELLSEARVSRRQVSYLGATGQGAHQVPGADFVEDEVTCVGAAVSFYLPEVRLALQLGGQSIAAVAVDAQGEVARFSRNDKCAAGTGRFVQMMSQRLGRPLQELDALVAAASAPRPVSSQCVVFAESEAISQLNDGVAVPDILAGICGSVGRIVCAQARRYAEQTPFTLTGGVARFASVRRVVCEGLDRPFVAFPEPPQLAAALGAALLEEVPEEQQQAQSREPQPPPQPQGPRAGEGSP
jgi:predicted CoA-substrate-specific enzyme activase